MALRFIREGKRRAPWKNQAPAKEARSDKGNSPSGSVRRMDDSPCSVGWHGPSAFLHIVILLEDANLDFRSK